MKQIYLTQGKIALVDDEDFEELNKYNWCCNNGYAVRASKKKEKRSSSIISMHVHIMKSDCKLDIDHINGNKLDNRKENLRYCTRRENIRNSKKKSGSASVYKGVNKHKFGWQVFIWNGVKNIHLGMFNYDKEIEAAKTYDEAAKKMFGSFARLNFPEN